MAEDPPRWKDLSEEEKALFGNGLGPFWLPDYFRNLITKKASWFFKDASWRHHDFGYSIGKSESDREWYDWLFYRAMSKDALTQDKPFLLPKLLVALILSSLFWLFVRSFGWYKSFKYSENYRTKKEIFGEMGLVDESSRDRKGSFNPSNEKDETLTKEVGANGQ